jgi:septum formation protein
MPASSLNRRVPQAIGYRDGVTQRGPVAFVLASGSAGRLRVLRGAGIDPEVVVSGVDETTEDHLETATVVDLLAERKALAVAVLRPHALVLGCDSMLDLDHKGFGKPGSPAQATDMWARLSGREGTLYTGHCLIEPTTGRQVRGVGRTVVRFGSPSDAEVAAYVASGEPMTLAGGFSIDGRSAPFVEGIDGDPNNVIGLSLPLLRRMLADLGLAITDLWRTRPGAG